MTKQFKVTAKSERMDAEFNTKSLRDAIDTYKRFRDSGWYFDVDLISNETGEVYASFIKRKDANGIKTSEWIAV